MELLAEEERLKQEERQLLSSEDASAEQRESVKAALKELKKKRLQPLTKEIETILVTIRYIDKTLQEKKDVGYIQHVDLPSSIQAAFLFLHVVACS